MASMVTHPADSGPGRRRPGTAPPIRDLFARPRASHTERMLPVRPTARGVAVLAVVVLAGTAGFLARQLGLDPA